ncbi:hypothetical protein CEXT_384851 [Caerostris extrusa]|uniref:Uncharacterized protein n=1 Tax=Caerostris extrusa TaxID=172846 RepID=A0AAV4QW44_CAEEX|nr:hypothetical protein CEXT_384851 [Caerostris extrusa]
MQTCRIRIPVMTRTIRMFEFSGDIRCNHCCLNLMANGIAYFKRFRAPDGGVLDGKFVITTRYKFSELCDYPFSASERPSGICVVKSDYASLATVNCPVSSAHGYLLSTSAFGANVVGTRCKMRASSSCFAHHLKLEYIPGNDRFL